MSHDMIVALQQKMGANFDAKAIMQRKKIEGNKCVQLLVEEIWQKQVRGKEDGDMDLSIDVDVSEAAMRSYKWYSAENYMQTMELREVSSKPWRENNY